MAWGYLIGKASSIGLKVNVNPYLLLFLAVIPDIDLLLGLTGIRHRTWTHSVLVWTLIFLPIFIIYRKKGIPYYLATVQHIVLGDFIVGYYNAPLWPVNTSRFSLNYGLLSYENLFMEALGLGLFLAWFLLSKKIRVQFLAKIKKNRWSILPLVPIAGFIVVALSGNLIIDLFIEYEVIRSRGLLEELPSIMSNALFKVAVALHVILLLFLMVPLVQGLRASNPQLPVEKT